MASGGRLILLGTRSRVATSKKYLVLEPEPFILPRDIQEMDAGNQDAWSRDARNGDVTGRSRTRNV